MEAPAPHPGFRPQGRWLWWWRVRWWLWWRRVRGLRWRRRVRRRRSRPWLVRRSGMVNEQALEIARQLQRDFGSSLKSVLLFGSLARCDYVDGVSNINLLVLMDDVNVALLDRAVSHAKR